MKSQFFLTQSSFFKAKTIASDSFHSSTMFYVKRSEEKKKCDKWGKTRLTSLTSCYHPKDIEFHVKY